MGSDILIGIIVIAIASVAAAALVLRIRKRLHVKAKGILDTGLKAQAVVVDAYGAAPNLLIAYEFNDHHGNKYAGKTDASSPFSPSAGMVALRPGDRFVVIYNPENPHVSHPEVYLRHWMQS